MNVRRTKDFRNGKDVLTVMGQAGAIQVHIWPHSPVPLAVMGMHATAPRQPGQTPCTCPLLGWCYDAGCTFLHAEDVARLFQAGQEEAAFGLMEQWYASRLAGIPA